MNSTMQTRLFKPGDRVNPRLGGPTMTVQKYVKYQGSFLADCVTNNAVECTWVDKKGKYNKNIFHQRNLLRVRH